MTTSCTDMESSMSPDESLPRYFLLVNQVSYTNGNSPIIVELPL